MVGVFLTALFALTLSPEPRSAEAGSALDRRCYALMAQLAREEDPQVRSAAVVGAQYFIGRIDAAAGGAARGPAEGSAPESAALLRRCADLMGAGGRDFRALGENLARRGPPV